MKDIFASIFSILESFGKARAATYFARIGHYDAAKKVMQE
jgi:hypothetical protein